MSRRVGLLTANLERIVRGEITVVDESWAGEPEALFCQVIVNDENVNARCYGAIAFSDGTIEAHCFKWNQDKQPYLVHNDNRSENDVAREIIYGPGKIIRLPH